MNYSKHANERLDGRLTGLVSRRDVERRMSGLRFKVGETWVVIKRLPKRVYLKGEDINGDTIYGIYRRASESDPGTLATVELRNHYQPVKGDYLIQ